MRLIFIISLLVLTGISSSKGAQNTSSLLAADAGTPILLHDDSGTQSQKASPVPDSNEDENELILSLPSFHFIDSLAISYSPCCCTASEAVEVITRPPKA